MVAQSASFRPPSFPGGETGKDPYLAPGTAIPRTIPPRAADTRATPRAIRGHRQGGRGRDGRGLPGDGHRAQARGRRSRCCRRPSPATPSGWRGSSAKRSSWRSSITRTSPPSLASTRPRGCASSPSSWSPVRRSTNGSPEDRSAHEDVLRHRRRQDRRGAGVRARPRDRAPRPEAGQRQAHAGRRGQDPRLRPGQGGHRRAHERRADVRTPTSTPP